MFLGTYPGLFVYALLWVVFYLMLLNEAADNIMLPLLGFLVGLIVVSFFCYLQAHIPPFRRLILENLGNKWLGCYGINPAPRLAIQGASTAAVIGGGILVGDHCSEHLQMARNVASAVSEIELSKANNSALTPARLSEIMDRPGVFRRLCLPEFVKNMRVSGNTNTGWSGTIRTWPGVGSAPGTGAETGAGTGAGNDTSS
jgi:hypothetical protein